PWQCDPPPSEGGGVSPWVYAMAYFQRGGMSVMAYKNMQCLDCTQKQGSKEKPAFWPNDHQ
ncbi:MAG: hypothetical protein LBK22_09865, partial [Tannerella sp.]|nr:hypothetical protein [Tannerella sp.]